MNTFSWHCRLVTSGKQESFQVYKYKIVCVCVCIDVAIGAPHEDDLKGAVYIYNGRKEGISSTPSQVQTEQKPPGLKKRKTAGSQMKQDMNVPILQQK